MKIIGTLTHGKSGFTRFVYEASEPYATLQAIHHGVAGYRDGEIEILGKVKTFDGVCRYIYNRHLNNPNFKWESDGESWWINIQCNSKPKSTVNH